MMDGMAHDLTWMHAHLAALMTAAGTVLVVLVLAAVWRTYKRASLAAGLRRLAIPLVLLWEAQGLYGVALRVGAAPELAYVLAGVTCAVILTFAAYAHEHYKKHETLGPCGRMMWYVAIPMGLIVAANATSLAGIGLRVVLPLLSVMAFRAPYLPDEPVGQAARQGSWRLTPRRLGVSLGLLDPSAADLTTVHAERRIRQLTLHAAGYHRGARVLRSWHGWRLERLALTATDDMLDQARQRVQRVHSAITATDPEKAASDRTSGTADAAPGTVRTVAPSASVAPDGKADRAALREPVRPVVRKPSREAARKMSAEQLAPYVGTLLEADPDLTKTRVMELVHVGPPKADEALRIARRTRMAALPARQVK